MKIKIIVFALVSSVSVMYTQQNMPPQQTIPAGAAVYNIHINTANKADLTQSNQMDQEANHHAMQKTNVTTNVDSGPDYKQKLYDFYEEQSKKFQDASTSVITWTQNNKLKTAGAIMLFCYSIIAYKIYQSNSIINDPNSWSNWHNSRSLDDLFATPQATLEANLLFAIQTRYVHPVNPTDFIYSIVQASNSLQEEMKEVSAQIARYKWLETCQCMTLFFIDAQELASLQEKHRKLSFLKHIFSSWCANYKIDKNS